MSALSLIRDRRICAMKKGGGEMPVRKSIVRALVLSSGLTAVLSTSPVMAAPDQDTASNEDSLGEIIVTAQKRTQNLQDVPVSVQVIGSEVLAQENQTSLINLSQTVPSLQIVSGGKANTLSLRGISSGGNSTFDQSVATFSDDIYHGRSRMVGATFLDIERIEILKGPQSTFFGNNAIAGALNIVSKKPTAETNGHARALYGMHGRYAVEGALGGGISDTVSARLALTANGQSGWLTDSVNGSHLPRERYLAGRLTIAVKPSSRFDATLKFEASKNRLDGSPFDHPLQWANCPPVSPFPPSFSEFGACQLAINSNVPLGIKTNKVAILPGTGRKLTNQEVALTLNYDLSGAKLTSVTGYSRYKFFSRFAEPLPTPFLQVERSEKYRQFSQEVRLSSDDGNRIEYILGAYFQTDRLPYDQITTLEFLTPVFQNFPPINSYLPITTLAGIVQREKIYSGFGSLTWNASNRLRLTGGLRASWVKKSLVAHLAFGSTNQTFGGFVESPPDIQATINAILLGGGSTPGQSGRLRHSSNALMPSAQLQYDIADTAMLYARYDRGFLAGGFNGVDIVNFNSDITEFGPEHVNAFEIGLKSELFDRKVRVNFDIFRSYYSQLQVSTVQFSPVFSSFFTAIANAGSVRSQGVEFEVDALIAKNFQIRANATYLDSKYTKFPNASPSTLQTYCGSLGANAFAATVECSIFSFPVPSSRNLRGEKTPYAPTWSGRVTAEYGKDISNKLRLIAQVSPYLTSSYYVISADPVYKVGNYVRLDARLSLESRDGKWGLDVIGKNLTDKLIVSNPGLIFASKEEPLNISVQFRAKF